MLTHGLARLCRFTRRCADTVRARISGWTKPRPSSLATGLATDLVRRRHDLLLENAFLRQQVLVLSRTAKRPALTPWDRGLLVLLASRLRTWAGALLIVQPETLLRWHRQGFRRFWRRTSPPRTQPSPLAPATIDLVKQMARDNRLWGAERIRGELLKLDIRVSKRTIQKYMREVPRARPPGQAWATFLRNHAPEIWACDFLQVTDLLFRPLFAFFLVEHGSRRVVHVGVTRHPTDAWVTQQLREATPYEVRPRFLIRDNDSKYGAHFAQLAAASGITVLRTPVRAPRANAITERFLRSVRRECLDHLLLLGEAHLRRALGEYIDYFNQARPHQGLGQRVPAAEVSPASAGRGADHIVAVPVLGGLHHTYRRAA
jgi:transposase InsO family protein